jgi:P-type Cu+ transporter
MHNLPGILLTVYIILGPAVAIPARCQAADSEQPAHRRVVISITGMMCSSCGQEIEKSLKKVAGVGTVKVDVPNDRVTVSYDERKVTPRQLAESIRKAGYEATLPAESPAPPARR